jgi:hypothetical protein
MTAHVLYGVAVVLALVAFMGAVSLLLAYAAKETQR